MKYKFFLSTLLCLGMTFSNVHGSTVLELDEVIQQALKETPNLEKGRALYRHCAICHSPQGWGSSSGHFPQIAGQHKSVIIKQMEDIHKGNRDNPTMRPFIEPVLKKGSQPLADLSAYISQLSMTPQNSVGSGYQLEQGKALYDKNCKQCHKVNGEGVADKFYPRIQGQHYSYLKRQLHWIKMGKRRNADKKMVKQIESFTSKDIDILADYISRLRPEKSLIADSVNWKNPDFRKSFFYAPRR